MAFGIQSILFVVPSSGNYLFLGLAQDKVGSVWRVYLPKFLIRLINKSRCFGRTVKNNWIHLA